jgi:hypothetical protein
MRTPDETDLLPLPPRRHWARRTHRVLGVSSLLFLVFISASGLVLNHGDALGLSQRAAGPWLLRLYGAEIPPVDSSYAAEEMWFATSSETLHANGAAIAKNTGPLIGAVVSNDDYIVATGEELFAIGSDGALIERFAPDVPGRMDRLGQNGGRIVVEVRGELFELDPQSMNLFAAPAAADDFAWSLPVTPSDEQARKLGAAVLGQTLNWERVLLDFHSGRLLPTAGRYIADLTALCLLYMCFTGILLWMRKR